MEEWTILRDERGRPLDFRFRAEQLNGELTVLVQGRWQQHNRDYLPGLEILLSRLARLDAVLTDCWVDSEYTRRHDLSRAACRLPIRGRTYPVCLSGVSDWTQFRLDLLYRIGSVGLPPGVYGSHTPLKTIRLAFNLPGDALQALASADLEGPIP